MRYSFSASRCGESFDCFEDVPAAAFESGAAWLAAGLGSRFLGSGTAAFALTGGAAAAKRSFVSRGVAFPVSDDVAALEGLAAGVGAVFSIEAGGGAIASFGGAVISFSGRGATGVSFACFGAFAWDGSSAAADGACGVEGAGDKVGGAGAGLDAAGVGAEELGGTLVGAVALLATATLSRAGTAATCGGVSGGLVAGVFTGPATGVFIGPATGAAVGRHMIQAPAMPRASAKTPMIAHHARCIGARERPGLTRICSIGFSTPMPEPRLSRSCNILLIRLIGGGRPTPRRRHLRLTG